MSQVPSYDCSIREHPKCQIITADQMSQLSISCMCLWLCLCNCVCLFVGQDMSLHHSDQMSGRYEDYYIVFCMSISKVLSEWVSQWQGHLLSCSKQLIMIITWPRCPLRSLTRPPVATFQTWWDFKEHKSKFHF